MLSTTNSVNILSIPSCNNPINNPVNALKIGAYDVDQQDIKYNHLIEGQRQFGEGMSFEKMKFEEFPYGNDTVKTSTFSFLNRIYVTIKKNLTFCSIDLGEAKNKTQPLEELGTKIIDKIDIDVNEEKGIIGIIYPKLETSIFAEDTENLNIRIAEYSLHNLTQATHIYDLFQKSNKETVYYCHGQYPTPIYDIRDLNTITYDRNNIAVSYRVNKKNEGRRQYETEDSPNIIMTINKNKKIDCHDTEKDQYLSKDIDYSTIIPAGNQEALVATYLDREKKTQSIQICISSINNQQYKINNMCSYYNPDPYQYIEKPFYLTAPSEIQAYTLSEIANNAVIMYASDNNLYSYIINGQTKIGKGADDHVTQGIQQLFTIEKSITQVHIGQVRGNAQEIYACAIDAENTLHCLYGEITQDSERYVINKLEEVKSIRNVAPEIFIQNTIESIYNNGISTTMQTPTTQSTTTTKEPSTTKKATTQRTTTTEEPFTTKQTTTKRTTITEKPSTIQQTTTKRTTITEKPYIPEEGTTRSLVTTGKSSTAKNVITKSPVTTKKLATNQTTNMPLPQSAASNGSNDTVVIEASVIAPLLSLCGLIIAYICRRRYKNKIVNTYDDADNINTITSSCLEIVRKCFSRNNRVSSNNGIRMLGGERNFSYNSSFDNLSQMDEVTVVTIDEGKSQHETAI